MILTIIKKYPDEIVIDAEFVSYLNPNTAVVVGNKIILEPDVTVPILQDKKVTLIAGNMVIFHKDILSYIKANAIAGNKVVSKEES